MAKEAGNFSRALAFYSSALPLMNSDPDIHLQLGHLRKLRGELEMAAASYAESLRLDPYQSHAYRELVGLGEAEQAYSTVRSALPRPSGPALQPSEKKLVVFTISANNYIPQAEILLESASLHYKNAILIHILCDRDEPDIQNEGSPVLRIRADQIGIPNFDDLAFRYGLLELCTAVKPFAMQYIFERFGVESIIYFDPDIVVFERSHRILAEMRDGASIVLTPHLLETSADRAEPGDVSMLKAGVFNLGFIAVHRSPEATSFLRWWADHLQFKCFDSTSTGLFVDQKFLDLAPAFFPGIYIHRSSAANVGYWNLTERDLRRDEAGEFTVDGSPLEFFHFSGYSTQSPHRLSKFTNLFSNAPEGSLAALMALYQKALVEKGSDDARKNRYGYERFASGRPINRAIRRLFAAQHLAFRTDPFHDYESCLLATRSVWENGLEIPYGIDVLDIDAAGLGHLRTIPADEARLELTQWLLTDGGRTTGYPLALLRALARCFGWTQPEGGPPPILSLVGYFRHESGMGESARRVARMLASAGVEYEICDVSIGGDGGSLSRFGPVVLEPRAPIELLIVNLDQVDTVLDLIARTGAEEPFRILMPFWETDEVPALWRDAFEKFDEIWAASSFLERAFARSTRKPVIPMSLNLDVPWQGQGRMRAHLGIPEDVCLFIAAFDVKSFSQRKNPIGAVKAFQKACIDTPGMKDGSRLLIKTSNGRHDPDTLISLDQIAAEDSSIVLWDCDLSGSDYADLLCSAQAVVSLHRAEGLGYLIADAVASGIPVISTFVGGPTDFLPHVEAWRIPYESVMIEPGQYPFSAGQDWAEPIVEMAASAMGSIFKDPELAKTVASSRTEFVEVFGLQATSRRIASRIAELRNLAATETASTP